MKFFKDITSRMEDKEYLVWLGLGSKERAQIAEKYLQPGEAVIVDSLGENIISNSLQKNFQAIKETLKKGFKPLLYPQAQRTDQYRRLIIIKN